MIELLDERAMASAVANFQLGEARADEDGDIDMPVGFFFEYASAFVKDVPLEVQP